MSIHPTAIISDKAIIDSSTEIGPFVIIEENVRIGKNNKIYPGAFIGRFTTIGDNNEIHMGAVVGHFPQDKAFRGEESYCIIGNDNAIREHASIHRGCGKGAVTKIGNGCLLMGGIHIAHNSIFHDNIIMANMAAVAGHVEVDDRAFLGGGAMVHQFVHIGKIAILSGNSRFSMDIPPFMIAAERNQIWGVNVIGLRRAGVSNDAIGEIRKLHNIFFKTHSLRTEKIKAIKESGFVSSEIQEFVQFVEQSKRGICAGVGAASPES